MSTTAQISIAGKDFEAPIRVVSESAVAVIGHLAHGASDIDGNRVRVVRICGCLPGPFFRGIRSKVSNVQAT